MLEIREWCRKVLGEDDHVNADERQRRGRPEPGPAALTKDEPGEQDGDQRLALLQHERLGKVAVRERLREEERGDRLRTNRDQPDRQPPALVQAAQLGYAAKEKRQQEEADQGVFDDDDLRRLEVADELRAKICVSTPHRRRYADQHN